jgi:hypothetical protein
VPTKDDFIVLDKALGGDGDARIDVPLSWISSTYINAWGGDFYGYLLSSILLPLPEDDVYWSSTSESAERAYALFYTMYGSVIPSEEVYKSYGLQVRCVR